MAKSGSRLNPDHEELLNTLPLQWEEGGAVARLAQAVASVR